jgi:glycosyltransferase involved in cell wall biosynthesis
MAIERISIGPGEVAGYFSRLKAGFDELGVPCEHFLLSANKFDYQESNYYLKEIFLRVAPLRKSKNSLVRWLGWALEICVRLAVFLYSLVQFDVFIFSGFGSFFRFYELPLLKLFGKKIIIVYFGSDARPPLFNGRHLDDIGGYVDSNSAHDEAEYLVKQIRRVEQYADVIINHTATAQFFSRSFVRFVAIGMPIDLTTLPSNDAAVESNTIRILHAPSRPLAKGSLIFRKILEELTNEGYSIEFVELVGVPNGIVLQELRNCHFVLDELYSDVPLAMLAAEAAQFGKPVVVGGYYADQFRTDNSDLELPPSLYVDPADIKQAIRKMIDDREFRLTLGRAAQAFVRANWNVRSVANNYLRLIKDDIPDHWTCTPMSLPYYWGWGLSKENWRKQVGEYVSRLGSDALMLNHNPKLKQLVLDEIQQNTGARTA